MTARAAKTPLIKAAAKRPARRRNVRKNVRVATLQSNRKKAANRLRQNAIIVVGLLLTVACGWGIYLGYGSMVDRGVFAVQHIEISGNARIPEDRILSRLNLPKNANLPDLDLATISQSVLSHPWIERATVRRTYPDTLAIQVWERTPAALLTQPASRGETPLQLMVDRSGMILGQPSPDAVDLPRLTGFELTGLTAGDEVSAKRVEIGLLVAHAYPDPTALVDVADLSDPLLLVGGMRIRLGDQGGYSWRLQRLQELGKELEQLAGKRGTEVDLRYPDRVVARPL
jgi:cell division protein FtsQ